MLTEALHAAAIDHTCKSPHRHCHLLRSSTHMDLARHRFLVDSEATTGLCLQLLVPPTSSSNDAANSVPWALDDLSQQLICWRELHLLS